MSKVILDGSLAISWVLPDESTAKTLAARSTIEAGTDIIVPSHWALEVANALCMAERRKRISQADTAAALASLDEPLRAAAEKLHVPLLPEAL